MLFSLLIFHRINWAHHQDCRWYIHVSSWPNVPKFQRKVQQTIVLTTELSVHTFSLLPFPFPLYMEMKRSFMLFPLVALFIAVWRFISWFHLRFHRLFLGKPLKCVSDSKQSFSRFLSLAPVASSLMIKKTPEIFKANWSYPLKPKPIQYCPKEGRCCSCFVADMKGEQRTLFVISLISIISAVWMNFKWLARSYLCYHRSNMSAILCSASETVALRMRWVRCEESWYVSGVTTRWWSYSWFKMRPDRLGAGRRGEENLELLEDIGDLGMCFKASLFRSSINKHHQALKSFNTSTYYIFTCHILSVPFSKSSGIFRVKQRKRTKPEASNWALAYCGGLGLETWNDSNGHSETLMNGYLLATSQLAASEVSMKHGGAKNVHVSIPT